MSQSSQSQHSAEQEASGLAPYQLGAAQTSGQGPLGAQPTYQDAWRPGSVAAAADEPYLVKTRQREEFARDRAEDADKHKPSSPVKLSPASWKYALKRTLKEFGRDQCTDLAAGLTYYAVLSVFPAMIAFVSILSLVGEAQRTEEFLLDMLSDMVEDDFMATIETMIAQVTAAPGAGLGLAIGVLVALWTASNYVNAFSRAMNRILNAEEGRSVLQLRPVLYGITAALIILVAAAAVMLVVSGPLAASIGSAVGLGETAVTVWNWATPAVLVLVAATCIALLYSFTPNIRQPGAKWISAGALVAIAVMLLSTVGVGFYIGNFANYEATYGALAGVIIFLFWIYIMNVVLLLGAEFNVELERARQLQGGITAERTLMLAPRQTAGTHKQHEKHEALVAAGKSLRISKGETADSEQIWRR